MSLLVVFFFFNDTATAEIYTLSLHDALPIYFRWEPQTAPFRRGAAVSTAAPARRPERACDQAHRRRPLPRRQQRDRKSTRLNSSHANISYAVFCLKNTQLFVPLHQLSDFHIR